MKIVLSGTTDKETGQQIPKITVQDLVKGYVDDGENGVIGYDGKLDIRPSYQREFIYDNKKRDEVIKTIRKDFPLNTMYWVIRPDGGYEIMDGQQRTISVCQYVNNEFSIDWGGSPKTFDNIGPKKQEQILNYELSVYLCDGDEDEKIDWFEIINIAGEELSPQELRNAIYRGPWVDAAKKLFAGGKTVKPPALSGGRDKYVNAVSWRQEILELVLKWICNSKDIGEIKEYMNFHKTDATADELWDYWITVFDWLEATFPSYNSVMKGIEWGKIYNKNKGREFDPDILAKKIEELFKNEEVDRKKNIYEFVLIENPKVGDDRKLSSRAFSDSDRQTKYAQQHGNCPICGEHFELVQMQADHITPWSKGGRTVLDNCQMLCTTDNIRKSAQVL
jgi:hypothetical protein